jgi:outer membrane protein OmpA-like peptidoglycan-associated protein
MPVPFFLLSLCTIVYAVTNPVMNESGQLGLKQVLSAQTLGASHLSVFFDLNFASSSNQIVRLVEPKELEIGYDTIYPKYTLCGINPAVSYGITDFLDAAVHIPFLFDIVENFTPEAGIGDLELDLKCRVPVLQENLLQSALYSSISLPIGNQSIGFVPRRFWDLKEIGEDSSLITNEIIGTYSNKKPEFSSSLLLSLCTNRIKVHANGGVKLTFSKDVDELLIMACGLEYCPAKTITLFTDIKSMMLFGHIQDGFQIDKDYLRWSPGIAIRSNSGMTFTITGDFDLSKRFTKRFFDFNDQPRFYEAKTQPLWGVTVQIGWNDFLKRPDRDGDLINDVDDKCPNQKEDFDNFQDADGCDDTDNDGDGVLDVNDSCRNISEDKDGILDEDGCPDFDNDFDNIADSIDKCPQSEDIDGFEDNDGCPDYDNDADGVADSLDKCPMVSEDRDNFEDNDGCPDLDNDLDGVVDSLDKCPQIAGSPKLNGCPGDVPEPKEIKFGRVILKGVDFGSGSMVMSEGSFEVLDQVVASMTEWSEIKLEVQTHTDNSGDPAQNIELCQKRADVICKYLINKGIAQDRLIPVGKGGSDPIADNETVTGRKLNNRVEIHRIN